MEGKWYVLANLSKTRHNLKTWLSWCMVKTSDNYLILPWDNIEHVYSTHKNKWERNLFFLFIFSNKLLWTIVFIMCVNCISITSEDQKMNSVQSLDLVLLQQL